MTIEVLITGTIKTWKHLIVHGASQGIPYEVPVPCYLVNHKKHKYLIDAGQYPCISLPSSQYIINMRDEDRAVVQLKKRGISPDDLDGILISHHHGDHVDGLLDFPHARCFLQKREADSEQGNILMEKYRRQWILLDGETDLFGDGKFICLPTSGHTAGHQSFLFTLDDRSRILLAIDAAYTEEALSRILTDSDQSPFLNSLRKLQRYQAEGIKVIPGHSLQFLARHFHGNVFHDTQE